MSSEHPDRRPDAHLLQRWTWLSTCKPWQDPDELAGIILSQLAALWELPTCGWSWVDPSTRSPRLLDWNLNTPPGMHSGSAACPSTAALLHFAIASAPHLDWRDCTPSETSVSPSVLLGLPADHWEQAEPAGITLAGSLFCACLEFQWQLHHQKLLSLAEYAAGAGHEINNPLGSIIGRASQLLREERDPERRRMLENIGAQAYRIRDMIGDSMLFARPPAMTRERVVPVDAIQSVAARFSESLTQQQVTFQLTAHSPPDILFDPLQFAVVISELIRNSLNALPHGGTIAVRLNLTIQDSQNWLQIDVTDNGVGLTEEQVRHCFDPFYSGRQAGRGLGFGLSKCWQILRRHNGAIEHLSGDDHTTFRLWIPVSDNHA